MADSISEEQISQFSNITGAPSRLAAQFLAASGGDLQSAMASYYAAQEDHTEDNENDSDYMDDEEPQASAAAGGHRLGDPSSSTPVTSSNPTSKPKQASSQKRFATLGDFNSGGNGDDDDDDDKQDFFAGGEKSGLAVQNPDDLKKRILAKAQKAGAPPADAPSKKSHFKGAAHTLGGDDTPSQAIPAAPAPPVAAERVERTLHFWTDGFSVDDGDLYRSDDPANAELLELIRRGRAPMRIMNVEVGQEVDVELKEHKEKYVKPKKKYKPFDGSGNRLGSPTPAASGMQSMPGAFDNTPSASATASTSSSSSAPTNSFDESQPTITLRISLGSGTRLTSRFNTTQTVGDIYDFVRRAEPGGREFVMQTTFPTMELKDMAQQLGEMAEFKRGGAVVQKYI